MEPILGATAMALGLHASLNGDLELVFQRFYDTVTTLFRKQDLEPTYVGIGGPSHSGKYVKFKGRDHQRALNKRFVGLTSLSVLVNPVGSNEPTYDAYATVSLAYLDAHHELLLSCVMNEAILPLSDEVVRRLLEAFLPLIEWYGGYAFVDKVQRNPHLFVLGLNSGRLSAEEERDLDAWYSASSIDRMTRLRGVFPYNILNEQQLTRELRPGVTTLADFITDHGMTLVPIGDRRLKLWTVKGDCRSVAAMLRGSGAMISDKEG